MIDPQLEMMGEYCTVCFKIKLQPDALYGINPDAICVCPPSINACGSLLEAAQIASLQSQLQAERAKRGALIERAATCLPCLACARGEKFLEPASSGVVGTAAVHYLSGMVCLPNTVRAIDPDASRALAEQIRKAKLEELDWLLAVTQGDESLEVKVAKVAQRRAELSRNP